MDVKKTVTDAGYIAIGLGVMGYQQAQTRRREISGKLNDATGKVTLDYRPVHTYTMTNEVAYIEPKARVY